MAFLTPDKVINVHIGNQIITINQKIVPDSYKAPKYITSYVPKGSPIKPCRKVNDGTGKPKGITVHNTEYIVAATGTNPAEQYCRATYNGNMNGVIVHYYVYENFIWQLLDDSEQGWHAADGTSRRSSHRSGQQIGGNVDTIAIEVIGNNSKSEDTTAKLIAYLCKKHSLNPSYDVYTHNYFYSPKYCPAYILPHWNKFMNNIQNYYNGTSNTSNVSTSSGSYLTLNQIVETTNKSITAIFREKGSLWSRGWHTGVDIGAATGVAIRCAADGRVYSSNYNSSFGNYVTIEHYDGRCTQYCHMVRHSELKVGETVKKGDLIGYVGSTGLSTGPHLHLNVYGKAGEDEFIDPIRFLTRGGISFHPNCSNIIVDKSGATKNLGNLDTYYNTNNDGTTSVIVTRPSGSSSNGFKVNDKVKVNKNAKTYDGSSKFASFVYSKTYYISELKGNRAVINDLDQKAVIIGAVNVKDLTLANGSSSSNTNNSSSSNNDTINIIEVGSIVKVKNGAKTYDGSKLASFVYNNEYYVSEIKGKRVVINDINQKCVMAAINANDLTVVNSKTLKVGSTVKVKTGAKTYDGKNLASFVYENKYYVSEIKGKRVVISDFNQKCVMAAINASDLIVL